MTWKRCADCGQPTAPNRVRCPRCLALVFGLELPNPEVRAYLARFSGTHHREPHGPRVHRARATR